MLDGILGDQILGDLCPHLLLRILLAHISPALPYLGDLFSFSRDHQLATTNAASVLVILGNKLAPPYAVVSLPGDLFLGATDAFHLHSLRAGRDVDNRPVFVDAVVAFAEIRALRGAGIVVLGFFGDIEFVTGAVGGTRASLMEAGGAATAGSVIFVTAAAPSPFALADDEVFVIVAAVAGSASSVVSIAPAMALWLGFTADEFQSHRTWSLPGMVIWVAEEQEPERELKQGGHGSRSLHYDISMRLNPRCYIQSYRDRYDDDG